MAKKSNKTSHVLSLIANKPEPADSSVSSEEMPQLESQNSSIIEVENGQESPVSELIREELEKSSKEDVLEMEDMEAALSVQTEIHEFNLDSFDESTEKTQEPKYFNIVEGLVKNKAIPTMRKLGMCNCDKCTSDVIALALNMLPPHYVVSDTGELYAKLNSYEKQYATDLLSAIAKACLQIKKNPRH